MAVNIKRADAPISRIDAKSDGLVGVRVRLEGGLARVSFIFLEWPDIVELDKQFAKLTRSDLVALGHALIEMGEQ